MAEPELGSTNAVRRILNKNSDNLTDSEIEPFLKEATRWIKAKNYNDFMLDKQFVTTVSADASTNKTYQTYFPMKSDCTVKVYYEGELKTEDTDYTLDYDDSSITFTDDINLSHGGLIGIFYEPDFFDDYANYIAAKRIVDRGIVNLSNSAGANQIYNNIRFSMDEYKKMIAMKPNISSFRDHREHSGIW